MKNYYGMDLGEIASPGEKMSGLIAFLSVWVISLYLIKRWIALRKDSMIER